MPGTKVGTRRRAGPFALAFVVSDDVREADSGWDAPKPVFRAIQGEHLWRIRCEHRDGGRLEVLADDRREPPSPFRRRLLDLQVGLRCEPPHALPHERHLAGSSYLPHLCDRRRDLAPLSLEALSVAVVKDEP